MGALRFQIGAGGSPQPPPFFNRASLRQSTTILFGTHHARVVFANGLDSAGVLPDSRSGLRESASGIGRRTE